MIKGAIGQVRLALLSLFHQWELQYLRRWTQILASIIFMLAYAFTSFVPMAYAEDTNPTGGGAGSAVDIGSSVQQAIPTTVHNGMTLPDFSKINMNSLPAMSEAGKIEVPPSLTQQIGFDLNASWNKGDKITSVIKAGHMSDLGVGSMSLNDIDSSLEQAQSLGNIGSITQLGNLGSAGELPLSSFDPATVQSISSMSEAIPGLKMQTISSIRPFSDLATKAMGSGGFTDALGGTGGLSMSVENFISQYPGVASLKLGETLGDLSGYSISEVPGLDGVPMDKLSGWQNSKVSEIPGLSDLPMDKMKGLDKAIDSSTWAFVARADVPLTTVEQDRKETVSGSFQAGFQVPCEGEGCAHLELTPIGGSQMDVMNMGAFANGKAWISGMAQLVPGGIGALKAVAGGLEPTGRQPYGSAFKQVIIAIDEPTGTAMSAMYFRYCHPILGCTPYILGPVPFMVYPEKMLVFLGVAAPVDDLKGINLPGSPLRGGDGFKSCGGGLSGDAVDKATAAVDKVAQMGGAFSTDSATAAPHISRLLKAFKDEGITCPSQIAYALATIQAETSWVNFGEGATASASDSSGYHGRGYIQHTHIEQYQKIDAAFGTNTVSNPDLLQTDMDLAAKAAARSFKEGWTGNGKTLEEAIPCSGQIDYVNARGMINDSDKAQAIAQAATVFYDALSGSEGLDKATSTAGGCGGGANSPGKPSPEGWYDPAPGAQETGPWGQYVHAGHFHHGSDLAADFGTPIYAAADGVIEDAMSGCPVGGIGDGCGSGYGNYVAIKHNNGYYTFYGHNQKVLVSSGQQVKGGEQIAAMGSSGSSTGSHSHFEVCQSSCGYGSSMAPSSVGIPHPFSTACEKNSPSSPGYCESW